MTNQPVENIQNLPCLDNLDVKSLAPTSLHRFHIHLISNGMAEKISLPIMVIKGKKEGPTVGITAAVHGNELNGIPIIQQLFRLINPKRLTGTIVCVPVVNVPGFLNHSRYFREGDLNRIFPGKPNGTAAQFYAYQFVDKIAKHFDYLIDLHTASFGRINSLYVRASLDCEVTAKMSYLQHPQIVIHNEGDDGTLRHTLAEMGKYAITVEVGNPYLFQKRLIKNSLLGLQNVLSYLRMIPRPEKVNQQEPVICHDSYWIYTDCGGILEVLPELVDMVKKGELIAKIKNVFGDVIREYRAPEDGIVIGKSTNPVGESGARILHLGIIRKRKAKNGIKPKK